MHRLKTGGKFIGGEVVIFLVAVTLYQGSLYLFSAHAQETEDKLLRSLA